jgi:uncharacterized membrane protein
MKKILIALAIFIGVFMFLYGAIAALVNQGLSLGTALTVFFLVVVGGAGLVWILRDRPEETPPEE